MGMFIVPSKVNDLGNHVALELSYVAIHSFGDLVLADMQGRPLVAAMVDIISTIATVKLWILTSSYPTFLSFRIPYLASTTCINKHSHNHTTLNFLFNIQNEKCPFLKIPHLLRPGS